MIKRNDNYTKQEMLEIYRLGREDQYATDEHEHVDRSESFFKELDDKSVLEYYKRIALMHKVLALSWWEKLSSYEQGAAILEHYGTDRNISEEEIIAIWEEETNKAAIAAGL